MGFRLQRSASGWSISAEFGRAHKQNRFQVLDLSTAHLPPRFSTDDLNAEEGVIAVPNREYGWFMHVPDDPVEEANGGEDPIDPDILAIQVYASQVGCDWVLIDRDGPIDPNLKTFDWSNA